MNIVPIAFAFDNNIIDAAVVCITSLLRNSSKNTFYDIFILHSKNISLRTKHINKLMDAYSNCRIQYRDVDDSFDKSFEIRGVTTATYYRLLLANIITEYDKIIYSDVDIIYQMDLFEVYSSDLDNYYLSATLDLGLNFLDKSHINNSKILEFGKYIQAGFVIFNLQKIRNDNLITEFKKQSQYNHIYQDQDILNICCKNKIKYLPPYYNVNDCAFIVLRNPQSIMHLFSKEECLLALSYGNVHYSGRKPWKEICICIDLWWEYYRLSPIYNFDNYFDFFFRNTHLMDTLSLWQRIKNLIKYFIYGHKK